jgi:hypothetical protein
MALSTSSTRSTCPAYGYSKTEVGGLWSLGVLAEIVVFMLMARLSGVFRCASFCSPVLPLQSCVF